MLLASPQRVVILFSAMTEDFKTEYKRLEAFLAADPDYARLDAECSRIKSIVEKQAQIARESECDFLAFDLCQDTLDYAVHDIPDFQPNNLALFSDELSTCRLTRGAKHLERVKRQCMIKGGEASKAWEEATDNLADVEYHLQQRRYVLVDVWDKKRADEKAAKQEAE